MVIVERYRTTRFWAVYEGGELLCVAVYRKGANAVKKRLEQSEQRCRIVEKRKKGAICCSRVKRASAISPLSRFMAIAKGIALQRKMRDVL